MMMTDRIELTAHVHEGAREIDLSLGREGSPSAKITVDAGGLTDLIRTLARLREGMAPQVAETFESRLPGADAFCSLRQPRIRIPPVPMDGHRIILIRHPGLGWLSVEITQDTANDVARWLVAPGHDALAETQGSA